MNQALAKTSETALAARDVALEFTPEQEQMIRDTFANGATKEEFRVLMEVARVRRLNPLLRQIHFVKRWDSNKQREVWSTQVSIDGMRAIAQRTGLYDGQDEPEYQRAGEKLTLARVKVYRKDWSRPAVGVAYFEEYVQKKKDGSVTQFWRDKPHIMLAKCAEAIAIRKAFPEDTAGLYVPEEMPQEERQRTSVSHQIAEESGAPEEPVEGGPFRGIMDELNDIEASLENIENFAECESLRQFFGSKAHPSARIPATIQAAMSERKLTGDEHKELSRSWQRINRKLSKIESDLDPGSAADYLNPENDGR